MNPRRSRRPIWAIRSRDSRRGGTAPRRHRRPAVEVLEPRRLLTIIAEFPTPTPDASPDEIATGPDGHLWFTEAGGKIGTIDPTTHAITEFSPPTHHSGPEGIVAGPDGKLWFTENSANRIGTIDLTTHAIVETTIPTANSFPLGIAPGPDGQLWFTEYLGDRIGAIDPATRAITEFALPTADSFPVGIAAGPDGRLWFAESSKLGVLAPPLHLIATAEPPAAVTATAPFGLTVAVAYQSGAIDTAFDGTVTLSLAGGPAGAALGGMTTVAAHRGIATFAGLAISRPGTYRLTACIDPQTTATTTSVTVAGPPTIVAEAVLFAGKGRRRHIVGYELDFSAAMDPARAAGAAGYSLVQLRRRGRRLITQPVAFRAAYDAAVHRVTLMLSGRPRFAQGGELVVVGTPPGGLTDASGVPLDGGNQGTFGDDGTFVIASKGKGISR